MKAVIFDLDGTVWDSMPVWSDMGKVLLSRQNINFPKNIVEILTPLGLTKGAEYLQTLGLKLSVEEIFQMEVEYAINSYRFHIPLKPGVESFMKRLKRQNIQMCAFTAGPRELFVPAYERLELGRYLDFAITTEELGIAKSEPDSFLEVTKRLGSSPEETLLFDDSMTALLNAKRAGLKVIGVYDKSAEKNKDEIKKFADGYIMSFDDEIPLLLF